jgi:hypothetical protein
MEGHIPSPTDTIHWDLPRIEQVPFVSSSAQRKNRRMLKQEKRVLPFSLTPLPEQCFLPSQCLGVFNEAEVDAAKAQHENEKLKIKNE